MKEYFSAVCKEPYRLFFPLGILFGVWGVSPWVLYALGWIPNYSGFFHSSTMILNYLPCFMIGFLLTAMPRFSGTPHASAGEVFYFLGTTATIAVFLKYQQWIWAEIFYIAWLLGLIRFALVRIKTRPKNQGPAASNPPREIIWIPLGAFLGIVGTVTLILGQLNILPPAAILIGKPMMEQGFLLSVVLGIGGFLIPRLMGTYRQSGTAIEFHLCAAVLLFLSFCFEGFRWEAAASGLKAFVIAVVFLKTGVLPRPPREKDLYIRLAWISSWMITIGFALAAIFPAYKIVLLHIAFIGGFSLMVFAVATMVAMAHAGEMEQLRHGGGILWVVAIAVGLALLKRLSVIFLPDAYFKFLGMAAFSWMIAALSWFIFVLPRLIKIPEADEFEQMHEQVKKKTLNTKL